MKQRIYINTSVVGVYFDEEFKEDTHALFKRLENGEVMFIVSDLINFELTYAPLQVKELLNKYSPEKFEIVT